MSNHTTLLNKLSECLCALNDCPLENYRRMVIAERVRVVNKLNDSVVDSHYADCICCKAKSLKAAKK